MAPNLSKRDRDRIDEALRDNDNLDMRELAALFHTTYSTIQKRRAVVRSRPAGTVLNRGGRPSIITDDIRRYVHALIERFPSIYLDEIADYIFMEFGI